MMSESVAETSEELMEKFFNGEYFSREETINGLRAGIADGSIAPVLCGSAVTLEGIDNVLETIVSATPSPADKGDIKAEIDGKEGALRPDPDGDLPPSSSRPWPTPSWARCPTSRWSRAP